ncbi:MAG: CAP domain-containing protein [Myxacorys californica WJT36-NPBG1]|jgi:uncharacterized protein YkwD|nr:CAP domain-containing protein [Myxacorys californica WJT36-NPBG1]
MQQSLSVRVLLSLVTVTLGGTNIAYAQSAASSIIAQANPPAPPPNSVLASPTTGSIEQDVFQQINGYRAKRGLKALAWDAQLAKKAREHSKEMANKAIPMGHAGFENRVKGIQKTIQKAVIFPLDQDSVDQNSDERVKNTAKRGFFRAAAENVAYNMGYDNPAAKAVQGWLTSSGHRHNIEGQYTVTGVGVSKNVKGEYYFTQIFIKQ